MASTSTISGSSVVRGNISGDGSLQVLGRVEGDVTITGDVHVAQGGSVKGAVSGARITVAGTIEGDATGADAVLLEASGSIVGDISAPRLAVAEGASLRGAVRTASTPSAPAETRPAVVVPVRAEPAPVRAEPAPVRAEPAPARAASGRTPPPASGRSPKKRPPPPVVQAPRGGRARKKAGRR